MKIQACQFNIANTYNTGFSSNNKKTRPCQKSAIPSQEQITQSNIKNKNLITYSALAAAGIAITGGALKLYTHGNPAYVLKNLKPTEINNSLPDFLKQELAKWNKFEKFANFIKHPDEKHLCGTGANSKVYNIPFLKNYVLKIIKPDTGLDLSKQHVGLFPNSVNLGQPVWQNPNNPRVLLLKKISGEPYSIKDWTSTLYNNAILGPVNVTQKQADIYFSKISQVAQMDQHVFDNLAHQIKILDTTPKYEGDVFIGFKTDCLNPNNLMVDMKNNTINIIDYFAKDNEHHKNSYMDMVAIMCDSALLPEYRDLLKPHEQKQLVNIIKTIHAKCLKAAQKEGLSTNVDDFREFVYEVGRWPQFQPMPVKKHGGGEYIRLYPERAEELISIINS